MKHLNNKFFLESHPIVYVSLYMRYDYFAMSNKKFLAKYMKELLSTDNNTKKTAITEVLKEIWADMPSSDKYDTINEMNGHTDWRESFDNIVELSEVLECNFLKKAVDITYWMMTGKGWEQRINIEQY